MRGGAEDLRLTCVYRHVPGQVVVGVEDLPTLRAGIGLLLVGQALLAPRPHLAGLCEGEGGEPEVLVGVGREGGWGHGWGVGGGRRDLQGSRDLNNV